ncbi:carboxypeptidase-like regulatory domain-containing protein [Thalassoglobus sp.]|uniref:carboxypeptidase-like regulatory domain-containing protein n=1 Tax=Thalassoglobus sp. TaxID=2795869 RepID=UPI003AA8A47A
MLNRKHNQILILLSLVIVTGCAPKADRESTNVKPASEVDISVGEVAVEEEETPTPSEPATAPSSTETATATPKESAPAEAAPKKEMAKPAATPVAAEAPASKAAANHTGPAKFFGRVSVKGTAPSLPPLLEKGAETKDAICAETAVPNEKAVVSKDGGLANVFVYMKRAPKTGIPAPKEDEVVEIDQKGCVFLPHAKIVRVGQPVLLKNSDPVAHNVNVKGFQNSYNNVVTANGSTEHTFEFVEGTPALTGCDFHTFMTAYILPLDHPWGAVTDENGNFEITDLPDGTWTFVLWHEAVGYVERSVKVEAAQNTAVEMKFEVNASKLSQ